MGFEAADQYAQEIDQKLRSAARSSVAQIGLCVTNLQSTRSLRTMSQLSLSPFAARRSPRSSRQAKMDPSMDGISPASSHASKPGRSPDDAPSAAAGGAEDKPAKKRKRAAATDKKHICPEPGCGKCEPWHRRSAGRWELLAAMLSSSRRLRQG